MSFDVVDSTCKYLESRLPGAPCFPEKPSAAPADFVTVERTGGQRGAFSDSPNLAVQAWSDEDWRAYGLALEAADALSRMWEMVDEVCRVEVGGIYRFPDPDSRASRYQLDVYMTTRL